MFSDAVKEVLANAGWSPDRKIDVKEWKISLESEGFTMTPMSLAILETFGGLTIPPQRIEGGVFSSSQGIIFNPVLAASSEFDRIDFWQNYLNRKLSPIGEPQGGGIFFTSGDGVIYMCFDGLLLLMGSSFEDAMENTLVFPKRRPEVIADLEHYL